MEMVKYQHAIICFCCYFYEWITIPSTDRTVQYAVHDSAVPFVSTIMVDTIKLHPPYI